MTLHFVILSLALSEQLVCLFFRLLFFTVALKGCDYVTNLTALTQIKTNIWKLRVIYIYVLTLIEINFQIELKNEIKYNKSL